MTYDLDGDRRSSMPRIRTVRSLVLVATALVVTLFTAPASAQPHGHRGGVYVGVGMGGFYGWGPYWGWASPWWGWGWGPGAYGYGTPGDYALGYAMMSGMGALDMNVNPKQAEVWVDGRYVAEARDLDGYPSYLWLKQGSHHVVVYKAGFRSFEEDVDLSVGMIRELKVKLEKGESQPPTRTAPEARPEPPRPQSPEPRPEAAGPGGESPGNVNLLVEPRDATVYVDGAYRGSARELPGLRLPAGHHRVELVRPGFRPLARDFDVEADRTIDLELSMEKGGGWKY
jgi:hypothetical protein